MYRSWETLFQNKYHYFIDQSKWFSVFMNLTYITDIIGKVSVRGAAWKLPAVLNRMPQVQGLGQQLSDPSEQKWMGSGKIAHINQVLRRAHHQPIPVHRSITGEPPGMISRSGPLLDPRDCLGEYKMGLRSCIFSTPGLSSRDNRLD